MDTESFILLAAGTTAVERVPQHSKYTEGVSRRGN